MILQMLQKLETPDEILQDRVNGENEQEPTAEDTETNTDSGIAKRVVSDYTSRVFPYQDKSHSFTESKTWTTDQEPSVEPNALSEGQNELRAPELRRSSRIRKQPDRLTY